MPLWVFEGIDGCGKETQYTILRTRIKELGLPVKGISFPVYESATGKLVKAYLDGRFGSLHPYFAALLFTIDRLVHKGLIEQWIQEGMIVLANRYVPSNLAHQAARLTESKRKRFFRWWPWLEYSWFGIPRPDLVIWLDAPTDVCLNLKRRQLEVSGRSADLHERDGRYQEAVRQQYERLFKEGERDRGWVGIDCVLEGGMLPKEVVAEKIWQIPQIRDEILERAILARCVMSSSTNERGLVAEFAEYWEEWYVRAEIDSLSARRMLWRIEGTLLRTVEGRMR